MLISIAIPCYRSENNLRSVVKEIREVFQKRDEDYQLILVCDGSPDHTDEVIRNLCQEDQKITGILLSRNFTQANAKIAAVSYAKGDALVYMDDDGQHPAEAIFSLTDKILEGYDAAYARFSHKKQTKFKTITSRLYGKIAVRLGIRPKGLVSSSFVAYSRFVYEEFRKYKSPTPTLLGFANTITTRFTNVDINQRERLSGQSGYNMKRLINLFITDCTNFTTVPLRIITRIGFIVALIALICGIITIIRRITLSITMPGYSSLIVIILLMGGMILMALGLVGEYMGRVYMVLSNKPQYVVREVIQKKEDSLQESREKA